MEQRAPRAARVDVSTRAYDRETAAFISLLIGCMPNISREVMEGWTQNPSALQRALAGALFSPAQKQNALSVWKTVRIGRAQSALEIRQILQKGIETNAWFEEIFKQGAFSISEEERNVDLVLMSVSELGFSKPAENKDVFQRAITDHGLRLCHPETALRLRALYTNQPYDEEIRIAMEPIRIKIVGERLAIGFRLESHTNLRIVGYQTRPAHLSQLDHLWVFEKV